MNIAILKSKVKSTFLYSICRPGYLLPNYYVNILDVPVINVTGEQIISLNDTTNNVKKIRIGNTYKYFRQCSTHVARDEYISRVVNDYFFHNPDSETKKWVLKSLGNSRNIRLFFDMGVTNDKYSRVSKYYQSKDSTMVGIDKTDDSKIIDELEDFIQFAWGEIYNYRLNNGLKKGQFQIYNACRGLATKAIADLLGLEDLIPSSQFVRLFIDSKGEMFGTLMDQAPGKLVKWESIEKRKAMITPQLQHSLNNLNLLDVICYERDHKPSNYNVILDENSKAIRVCAFDNDSPLTFFIYDSAQFKTFMNCSPYVNDGAIARPYIDKNLAERILSLTDDKLDESVMPFLSKRQISSMNRRFAMLRQSIKDSLLNGTLFAIDDSEWDLNTVQDELSGKYGRTYLSLFGEDLHLPTQNWIRKEVGNR